MVYCARAVSRTTERVTHLSPPIRFGIFEVDPRSGELRKQGVKIKLQDQPHQVLVMLLERPGEVLTREDLQKKLWPADTFVDFDRGLNRAINRLREALGDNADSPRFIETLPRRGYRFIASVQIAVAVPGNAAFDGSPLEALEPHPPSVSASNVGRSADSLLAARAQGQIRSLAVLPLQSLSGDPAQEYFVDGMTDELITVVAKISQLRVISRTSAMHYKGANKPLPAIARELGVDAVVEGTVMRSGQKVRITAHLIHAADDRHLWSDQYERDLGDILALQGEVAQAIADRIHITLTQEEHTRLARARRVNPKAYEAYLRGTFFRNKWTEDGLDKSIDFFDTAIALDPDAAQSHAGLAHSYCAIGILGTRPAGDVYPRAKAAARTALALDETVAEAHFSLADVQKGYDWDWTAAEESYTRALALDPSNAVAHTWYADYLCTMSRSAEAIVEAGHARELDPISVDSQSFLGFILYRARRYDEALAACHKAVELDPYCPPAHWFLGLVYEQQGDFRAAIAAFEKAVQCSGNGAPYRALLANALALNGDKAEAMSVLDGLRAQSGKGYVSPLDYAIVFTGLSDCDSAFEWLEKAYHEHTMRILELRQPIFDSLRADPRFQDLLRRIGLPS